MLHLVGNISKGIYLVTQNFKAIFYVKRLLILSVYHFLYAIYILKKSQQ